jgi:isopropylmalate/homocitrate/citramalate synthase
MLKKNIYPTCAKTFAFWCSSNEGCNNFYNKLKPQLFDVTLRDGLQGLSIEEQKQFTFTEKKILYHKIISNQNPVNIEIGSIVSEKVLPIFKDTLPLVDYIFNCQSDILANSYIVVPNKEKLKKIINNTNINNFSFITSVSNSFQLKNTKLTLVESDNETYDMLYQLEEHKSRTYKPNVKLYVSCINECPIEGKIDNDFIVNRLLQLHKMNVDMICLSDTCGSLEIEDFEYIFDTCHYFGIPASKFSLHLHVKNGRENIVEQLIHMALDRKITNFDVSLLESGGCSVTMKKENLTPNLSYALYYKALSSYILKKTTLI